MADSPEKQRAMRKSPFLEWCDEERLKVISGFGVEDLATAELAQWERLGGPAALDHHEGGVLGGGEPPAALAALPTAPEGGAVVGGA